MESTVKIDRVFDAQTGQFICFEIDGRGLDDAEVARLGLCDPGPLSFFLPDTEGIGGKV